MFFMVFPVYDSYSYQIEKNKIKIQKYIKIYVHLQQEHPKNTNPKLRKSKNTCPDFLRFSCPFLSTKHKHKSISNKNTNTNLAADLLRFSHTTKPRYIKSQLKPRFSHLSINNETSSK